MSDTWHILLRSPHRLRIPLPDLPVRTSIRVPFNRSDELELDPLDVDQTKWSLLSRFVHPHKPAHLGGEVGGFMVLFTLRRSHGGERVHVAQMILE